jgi:ABC-type multidrug transport system fused ATPase/permease subunit
MNFKKTFNILDIKEKKNFIVLTFLILISTLLETFGITMIIPLVTILVDGNLIENYPVTEPFIKMLGSPSQVKLLIYVLIFFNLFYFFKLIYLMFLAHLQSLFTLKIQTKMGKKLFSNYLRMPYIFHTSVNSSILIRNTTSEISLLIFVLRGYFTIFQEIFLIVCIGAFLLFYNFQVTIIIILIFVLFASSFYSFLKKKLFKWGKERQKYEAQTLESLQNGFGAIKDIKIFNVQNFFTKIFDKSNFGLALMNKKQYVIQQIPRLFIEFITLLCLTFLIVYTIDSSTNYSSLLPTLALFGFAAFRLMPSVYRLMNVLQDLKFNAPVITNLSLELENTSKNLDLQNLEINDLNKNLGFETLFELQNINFSYDKSEKFSLENINLSISKGMKVGIIGESGSGKSTLADIILGLIKPENGEIIIDGIDITKNFDQLRKIISYVPQQIYMTDDTILNNIAFGVQKENINKINFDLAIKNAQIKDYINSLDHKENTRIGEGGIKLSGGQRQRLGIARSLYSNPQIILFDEATSALDMDTESNLMEAIEALSPSKTIIIITHRLSTIKNCDIVYVLDKGKIIKKGTPKEIL